VVAERLSFLESDLVSITEAIDRGIEGELLEGLLAPRFESVLLVDDRGAVHTLFGSAERLLELSEGEQAHLASVGSVVALDPESTDVPRVLLVTQTSSGILQGEIRAAYLWGFEEFSEEETIPIAVHGEGRVLFSNRPDLLSTEVVEHELGPRPVSGRFVWDTGEQPYVGSYWTLFLTPKYGVDWTIVAGRARGEVVAAVREFQTVFVLVLVLTFLLVLLVSMRQVRRSLVPIAVLREAARRLGEEGLETRVALDRRDEFGDLAETFNRMADRICERTEELERANHVKGAFLANMSHEIRTPMTSIIGYAELCRSDQLDHEERERYLEIVVQSSGQLLELINEVLDFSKLESGRTAITLTSCEPAPVVAEVVTLLEQTAREKGIELHACVDGQIPATVETDPARLRQILVNLIGNALKFTEEGDVSVVLGLDAEAEQLVIDVVDTGIGMSPGAAARVFEPFVQADDSMSRRFGGTGLGLSISRSLACLLGGDIGCDSEQGEGSRFRLTVATGSLEGVELREVADLGEVGQRSEVPALAQVDLSGLRVLLAEDVAVNRALVKHLLQRAGIQVRQATNGREALEEGLASLEVGRPYDVVLMDMQMPVMDGYEATRRLREAGYTGSIVALTAHSVVGERTKCLRAVCDSFATKPIGEARLLRIVQEQARRDPGDPGGAVRESA